MVKKEFIIVCIICLFGAFSHAQVGIKAGFSLGIPYTPNEQLRAYSGVYLGVNYQFSDHIIGEIATDAIFHSTKTVFIDTLKCIFPVIVSMKYLFSDKDVQPYLGIGAGAYFFHQQSEAYKKNQIGVGIRPEIGVHIQLADNLFFDTAVIYHLFVDENRFQTLLGFNIGFDLQL